MDDTESSRIVTFELLDVRAIDDVFPRLVAVEQRVSNLHLRRQRMFDDAHVRDDARPRADVNEMVRPVLDVVGHRVRSREPGDDHLRTWP